MTESGGTTSSSGTGTMTAKSALFIGVGAMVGAGIFALLGQAGAIAEGATWLSFLVAGAISLFLGYSFVKLGLRYPSRGGLIEFLAVEYGSGPLTGGLSLLTLLAGIITLAMAAITFGSYGAALLEGSDYPAILAKGLAIALIALLSVVIAIGTGAMNTLQSISVVVVVTVLVGISLIGLTQMDASNLDPASYPQVSTVIASLGLTFFAYTGFQIIANSVEDMRTPTRELPIAMYGAIGVATAVYVLVAVTVFGVLGADEVVKDADTAIIVAAREAIGQWGVALSVLAAAFATVSTVLANLYFGLNTSYSLAVNGSLPSRYARQAWKGATFGLILTVVIAVALVAFLDVNQIASAGSIVYMVVFFMINTGHIRLRSETGASLPLLAAGTILLLVAAVPFLVNTWQNERVVVWFTIGSLVAAVLFEIYLSKARHRTVPASTVEAKPPDT
jgi:amino acid transporter